MMSEFWKYVNFFHQQFVCEHRLDYNWFLQCCLICRAVIIINVILINFY